MFATGIAILLSMATTAADPVETSRKTYSNCLREFHNTSVKDKIGVSDFREKIAAACIDERSTYNTVVVRSERGFGSSLKDAEAYASEEIQAIVDVIVTAFSDNVGEGSTLPPEK
jgi:hypothetical protein